MRIHNKDVSDSFNKIADLLDIAGENPFKIRAYRRAAQTISGLTQSVADMVDKGEDLTLLPGIGRELAKKIEELVKTGSLSKLRELEQEFPPGLTELMEIPDLGPKRVKALYQKLDIKELDDLEKALEQNKIQELEGFGEKTESRIREALSRRKKGRKEKRMKFAAAEEITEALLKYLRRIKTVKQVDAAGSFRRKMETVGDLDILVICNDGPEVMERFIQYEDVNRVLSKGTTRSSVILRGEIQVDLRAIAPKSYGAALMYFTGSKSHNVEIRMIAVRQGLKINEYGVFKGETQVAGKTEEEVYAKIGLAYIEPELRENRGEVEAAQNNRLPALITPQDIKGDLHTHTTATDGKYSLEQMAQAARKRGYEYLAVTDHSKRIAMANGLDEKRLRQQIDEIDQLNERLKNFRLLKSVEVDILEGGSLDLSDDILKELDLVVCAIHYNFNLSRDKQTARILRAMDNPYFNIFAHPTGRLIGQREPYDYDMDKVMKQAKDNGCIFEINAQPDRLDLVDHHIQTAKEIGLKFSIGTDAHTLAGLNNMRFGIFQARRGWLEKEDVINSASLNDLHKLIKRK